MKKTILALVLPSVLALSVKADVLTVGSIADTDCDFNSIQTALDSGASFMDIRVTNQQVYAAVSILDKDVEALTGGFDTCAAADLNQRVQNYTASEISGNDNNFAIYIDYDTQIFRTINISGFNLHSGIPSGLQVRSSGNTTSLVVNITETSIYDNADHGLEIIGQFSQVDFQGSIYNNINSSEEIIRGAGVYCSNGIFTLRENSAIYNNIASLGGGIYTSGCDVTLLAGDNKPLDSLEYGIFNNHAFAYGGGVRFDDSNVVAFGSSDNPVSISNNTSEKNGAGIYLSSGNFLEFVNARIDGNVATLGGGGLYMLNSSGDSVDKSEFKISQLVDGCHYAEICSSISFNKALGTSANYGGGAFMAIGLNDLYIYQTLLKGDQAYRGAVYHGKNSVNMVMEGNLIIDSKKDDTSSLALSLFTTEGLTNTEMSYSTIANNNVIYITRNNDAQSYVLNLNKVIIFDENDTSILSASNNTQVNVNCSILHNDTAVDYSDADTVIAMPGIIGNGNYKLLADSIAINPACTNDSIPANEDIRAQDRLIDGDADIGAYESLIIDDVIFNTGFE